LKAESLYRENEVLKVENKALRDELAQEELSRKLILEMCVQQENIKGMQTLYKGSYNILGCNI